jgi:invasion protein IalB
MIFVVALAALVFAMPVYAQEGQMWFTRCEPAAKEGAAKQCEAFQRLMIKESQQRIAEFAVGFGEDKSGAARGVFILPLGILLSEGVQMQIDEGKAFKFNIRYCEVSGCYAFVNLNAEILDMMRKGNKAIVTFQSTKPQTIRIEMSLKGFGKAFDKVS